MFPKSPWLALAATTPSSWGMVPQSGVKALMMPPSAAEGLSEVLRTHKDFASVDHCQRSLNNENRGLGSVTV